MEVTYTQTRADVVAFTQFHANRNNKVRWLTPLANGFLVLVWLMQLFFIARMVYIWRYWFGHSPILWQYNILHMHQRTLLLFLFSTLYLVYLFWGQKWLAARNAPAEAVLNRPRTVQVSPGGVRVMMEGEDFQRAWADMGGVDSDKDRVYLYMAPATAIIVPRRAFHTLHDAQAFEAEARACASNPHLTQTTTDTPSPDVWPPPPSFAAPKVQETVVVDPLDTPLPGTVEVAYVTRPADLWRSQWRVWRGRPSVLLPLFVPYAVGAFVWICFIGHVAALTALALSIAAALVITLCQAAWITRTALRKHFARFPAGRSCRTVLRPDGLFDITPEGRTVVRWRDVTTVTVRDGGDVLIRTAAGGGRFVPRSAFASERERAAFVEALRGFQQAAGA